MKKKPGTFPGATIRRTWRMNPVTRVHDGDPGKNKKAERRTIKKRLAEELRDEPPAFCYVWAVREPPVRPLPDGRRLAPARAQKKEGRFANRPSRAVGLTIYGLMTYGRFANRPYVTSFPSSAP